MFALRIFLCVTLFAVRFRRVDSYFQHSGDGPCYYEQRNNGRLLKLQGVEIGYHRDLNLDGDEKIYRIITKALKPTIFEIPNFLSDSECEHFKSLAQSNGLKESVAGFDEHAYQGEIEDVLQKAENKNYIIHLPEYVDHFKEWDKNKDMVITIDEIKDMCERSNGLFLSNEEVIRMFRQINYTHFEDGELDEEEFDFLPINSLDAWLSYTQFKHPFHRSRYSQHTWLTKQKQNDIVLRKIYQRVVRLTQLPRKIIEGSEDIQIVKYGVRGHYHAHYDSTPEDLGKDVPCCHQNHDRNKECKLCRILTILYYLNDVNDGGETAFLVADNKTLDKQYLKSLNKIFNLSKKCQSSNLVVPATKGTAIMWYNHEIDSDTRWLGNLDYYTIHGGCDVIQGEKWIANSWINAPTAKSADIPSVFS